MSKEYCKAGHPEILHWETVCPLCDLRIAQLAALALLGEKIAKLEGEIEDRNYQIEQLRREIGI
jgi:hypothetical protein